MSTAVVPVPWQEPTEFAQLLALYEERAPKRVLEIGTYEGGTLYHWLKGRPDLVVTVDDFRMGADNRVLYDEWVEPGTRLEVIAADSQEPDTVARVAGFAPFDWCFIDADHSYHGVCSDWINYGPLVSPGGVVAFHDIARHPDPRVEVYRLWSEIKASAANAVEFTEKGVSWGGIGVVFV